MNFTALTTTELTLVIALVLIVIAGAAALLYRRNRRSERLRNKFGGAEYTRAVNETGNRRHAEAGLEERAQRVESFNVRPIAPADRARFEDSWRKIQSRFVDGPAGAV